MTLVHFRQISDMPFVVQVDDLANDAFCRALPAPFTSPGTTFYSNTAGHLWGLAANDAEADALGLGGSAYIVSSEAFKRIKAGRLS